MDAPQSVHHETSDANVRAVFVFAAGLAATVGVVALVVWVLFQYLTAREARSVPPRYPLSAQESPLPPAPRLQTNPRQDLRDLRAHEDEVLGSYGWVDKNAGVVRIPIDRAMSLIVERGLPARQESAR